jgi:dipeptidyl aminopeptidase/acylaminoacyl peptidase
MSLTPGTEIGPYIVESLLGIGGMGEVYQALDPRLGRSVAIKLLAPHLAERSDAMARLRGEARTLASLNDVHILAIHDTGEFEGKPYLVTEFLEGEPLTARIAAGPQPRRLVLAIAAQIASGLARAHERGIVHRDLKPSNLFLAPDGTVKILDFGLARNLPGWAPGEDRTGILPAAVLTQDGVILGSVGYMAPEQVRGAAADARSDLFALGVVMLELLTGRTAFTGDSAVEVMHAILRQDPLEDCDLPTDLRPVLARLLNKDPEARFQTARDLALLLEALGAGAAGTPTLALPARPRRRPARALQAGMAIAAVLTVLGTLAWSLPWRPARNGQGVTFSRITPRPGQVIAARITPDGRNAVYSATGSDGLLHLNVYHEGRAFEDRQGQIGYILALGEGGDHLYSDYALPTNPGASLVGDLLCASGPGTQPRTLAEEVQEADYSPASGRLALLRSLQRDGKETYHLECPPGHEILRSDHWIAAPRFNPAGDRIAYLDHVRGNGWAGQLVELDLNGRERWRSREVESLMTFAWAPRGRGFLVSTRYDGRWLIAALERNGRLDTLLTAPANLVLMDAHPSGRILVDSETESATSVVVERPGGWQVLELPQAEPRALAALSPDGRVAAYTAVDPAHGGGPYLLELASGSVKRLGAGQFPEAVTHDGNWILAGDRGTWSKAKDAPLSLLSAAAGNEVRLDTTGVGASIGVPRFLPGTRKVLFQGVGRGRRFRFWILDPERPPSPVPAPPDDVARMVPIGPADLVAYSPSQGLLGCTLGKESWHPLPLPPGTWFPLEWDARQGALVLTSGDLPERVDHHGRLGADQLARELPRWLWRPGDRHLTPVPPFRPADPELIQALRHRHALLPDRGAYFRRTARSHLYFVDGLGR